MATRAAIAAVVSALAACAGTPPTPAPAPLVRGPKINENQTLSTPAPFEPSKPEVDRALVPRPDIDVSNLVPDPTQELRWPLSMASHPELQPHFEIAAALAEPGVGWTDLCRLGAHNRHLGKHMRDHVAYLRAWCNVGKQDLDAALASLVPLTSSVVLGLAPAVRIDFANILVSSGNANDASRLLTKHRITDVSVLDALAASYVEVGKLDDAYEINELAIAADDRKNHANRCRRLTRRIVLRPPPKQIRAVDLPNAGLFDVRDGADATCTRLERELECWLDPVAGCDHYFADHKLGLKAHSFVVAYSLWPSTHLDALNWWGVANNAGVAVPHPGADILAVAALKNDLYTTRCDSYHLADIVALAMRIRGGSHAPAIDGDLAQIIDRTHLLCLPP